jgi:hypothetical protein
MRFLLVTAALLLGTVAPVRPSARDRQTLRPAASAKLVNSTERPDILIASSGKSVGDGERQRADAVRNRRNFLQLESKDLCWSSPPS